MNARMPLENIPQSIIDEATNNTMVLDVRVKHVYGLEAWYPACKRSEIFCRLAGTKTLTKLAIRDIKELGYTFNNLTPAAKI